jgi:hypothetical protein
MTAIRIFRLSLGALGVGVLAYGVRGLLTERNISDHAAVGEWLVGGVIGHDALLAPVVFVLCAIAYRFTNARWRGRLAALLLIGGSLILISVPALLRKGLNSNKTVLPLDYARNLGVLLAVLVAGFALYGGIDASRRRRAIRRAAATEADDEPPEEVAAQDEPDEPAEADNELETEPEAEPEAEPSAELEIEPEDDESRVEDDDEDDKEVRDP